MIKENRYGWLVSITGGVNGFLSSGPTFFASSVIFRAVENEFNWSRTLVSGVATFGRFGGSLFGPFEGWLIDKFGVGKMVFVGFFLAGLGLICFSLIQNAIQYYLSFFLISLGFSIGGFTPSITAVNNWVSNRKATAMSLVTIGSTLGALTAPILVWGISDIGWRYTILILGVIILVAGVPLARVLGKPAPKNSTSNVVDTTKVEISNSDFTPKEALKTRSFWALSLSHMLVNASLGALMAHIYFYLTDKNGPNLDPEIAGIILPIMAIFSMMFQFVGGILGDTFSKRFMASGFIAVQGLSILLLIMAETLTGVYIFAVVWGIGYGGRNPLIHAMRGEYFGRKHFATITGLSSLGVGISMMISPLLVGMFFDIQNSYEKSFYVLFMLCLVSSLVIIFSTKPIKKHDTTTRDNLSDLG